VEFIGDLQQKSSRFFFSHSQKLVATRLGNQSGQPGNGGKGQNRSKGTIAAANL
jgi:hypothetical protein